MLPDREELSELYPKPKTYVELQERRKQYEVDARPRRVSIKIGIWSTLAALLIFSTYHLVSYLIRTGLQSETGVIFSVFFSMFVFLLAFALLSYIYSLISALVQRVLVYDRLLHFLLFLIVAITFGGLYVLVDSGLSWIAITLMSLLCFTLSSLAMKLITNSQQED